MKTRVRCRWIVAGLGASALTAAAAFAPIAAVVGSSGCVNQDCQGDIILFGGAPGQGQWVDENTWQTTPDRGKWLDYPAQRIWIFNPDDFVTHVPDAGGDQSVDAAPVPARVLRSALVYVSPAEDPNRISGPGEFGDNYAPAAGNTAEITYNESGVFIHNDTCAHYFMRAVLTFEPRDGSHGGDPLDGGIEGGDATGAESASDAPTD